MSTLLRKYGLRFHFYQAEPENERPHIHIDGHGAKAKVWLDDMTFAKEGRFAKPELKRIMDTVEEHREAFLEAWNGRDR